MRLSISEKGLRALLIEAVATSSESQLLAAAKTLCGLELSKESKCGNYLGEANTQSLVAHETIAKYLTTHSFNEQLIAKASEVNPKQPLHIFRKELRLHLCKQGIVLDEDVFVNLCTTVRNKETVCSGEQTN
ncbi:hypothetical protein [Vibrio mediterranei]|uniref:hypothetical protein n=1 Tax=Vibrio mediterranei TaxID=689 RepID=UPI004067A7A2